MKRAVTALSLGLLVACSASNDRPTEPSVRETTPSPAPAPSPRPAPAPSAPDSCDAIIAGYARVIDARNDGCTSATDCACYQGGVGPRAGCGGVTGAATAAELGALLDRYRAANCDYTQRCAPWACQPRCVDGSCSR